MVDFNDQSNLVNGNDLKLKINNFFYKEEVSSKMNRDENVVYAECILKKCI